MIKKFHIFFILLVLCGSGFVFADDKETPLPTNQTALPQQFEGFNLQGYTETGEKSWDVTGATADVQGSQIKLTDVNANHYGDEKVNLTAKNGVVDQTSGQMHLDTDVVITSDQGQQLKTESLDWDRNKDLVTTNDKVQLTTPDQKMEAVGTGAEMQPGAKKAKLNEDVTVKVNTEPDKAIAKIVTITCDGSLDIDQNKQKAVFHDNVVAVQDDRTLKADKITVVFDAQTKQIKQLICEGNVSIVQGENKTYAEEATYTAADQTLTLKGRPKLILLTNGDKSIASFRN